MRARRVAVLMRGFFAKRWVKITGIVVASVLVLGLVGLAAFPW